MIIEDLQNTHFGQVDAPPVDWRAAAQDTPAEDNDPDEPATPGLIALLGFDPDEP